MGTLRRIGRACLLIALIAMAGCNAKDADHLARVGQKVAAKSQALTSERKLSVSLPDVRSSLNEGALGARVAGRISCDKILVDAAIEVQAKGGHVHLTGVIKNQDQRRRAVELAQATVGVDGVSEELVVREGNN